MLQRIIAPRTNGNNRTPDSQMQIFNRKIKSEQRIKKKK